MEVLELLCDFSALSKVRSIFSGSERAALCHGEVRSGRQDFFDPGDAQAGGFLQFAPAGETGHRAALFVIVRLLRLLVLLVLITTTATVAIVIVIFLSICRYVSLQIFFRLGDDLIKKGAEFLGQQACIVWLDIEVETMSLKVLVELDHDSLLVHVAHDLGHVLARVALAPSRLLTCKCGVSGSLQRPPLRA